MVANRKVTGTASTMPVGLAIGLAVSLLVTVLGAALSAYFVLTEKIPEEGVGYCAGGILLLSSMLGAFVAEKRTKRKRLIVCVLLGGLYYAALTAATALFFGGQYQGMGVTALLVLAGSGCVGLLAAKKESGGKGVRKKYRIR